MDEQYHDRIADCCRQLRLSSGIADSAYTVTGDNPQEYLYRILENEIVCRRNHRISQYMNAAGFPRRYSFSEFRTDEVQFPSDLTPESLMQLDFCRDRKNIIMYGGTGTGKTMLSICIGIAACEKEIPVRFFRTAAFINRLSESYKQGELTKFKKKLNKAEILILDEFGYIPYDRTGAQLLFDYLSEIHEKKSVILNTNLEFSRWANILYDEQMTSALVGRLMHHCHLILFPGTNNRLRESSIQTINRS